MEQLLDFLDKVIYSFGDTYTFTFRKLILVSLVSLLALLTFRKYQKVVLRLMSRFQIHEKEQKTINRAVRIGLLWLMSILFLKSAGLPLEQIMDFVIHGYNCTTDEQGIKTCSNTFKVSNIVNAVLAYFVIRIILWSILQLMISYYKTKKMDPGSQYAINQLIKYVVYTAMLLTLIQALGFQLTVIWGGAAALLVGFGLGLQQTFNDLFSGVLIMVEGSIHVGDMVRVKGEIGKVTKIGIRASEIRMRDDVELIVPNSHLVMDSIANWNHSDHKARFFVAVGVAYGSDTDLVKKILMDIAAKHSKVVDYPEPFVRFADFGDSSLRFELHFWTFDVFRVLTTQSDLRFEIDKAFRKNNIQIPFPSRDLWIRNANELKF